MLRRFNTTGRQKIEMQHSLVRILPADDSGVHTFEVELDLTSYQFDAAARVQIEAWRSNIAERWELGAVGHPAPGTQFVRSIRTVPLTSQFKLKVIAGDGSGKLLGASAPIKPKLPTESLIHLDPTEELDGEVWRVDFGDGDVLPVLQVNSEIEAISEIVRNDDAFRSLVMPQVLRTVLTQIIFVQNVDPDDDEENWCHGWFRLAKSIHPGEIPKLTDRDDSGQQGDARELD